MGQREIKFPSKRLKRMRNGLKHKPISSASPQDGAATLLMESITNDINDNFGRTNDNVSHSPAILICQYGTIKWFAAGSTSSLYAANPIIITAPPLQLGSGTLDHKCSTTYRRSEMERRYAEGLIVPQANSSSIVPA